jgi:hypothetical protein
MERWGIGEIGYWGDGALERWSIGGMEDIFLAMFVIT